MFSLNGGLIDLNAKTLFMTNIWILPFYIIGSTPLPKLAAERLFKEGRAREYAASLFIALIYGISLTLLIGQTYNPFLYFRF